MKLTRFGTSSAVALATTILVALPLNVEVEADRDGRMPTASDVRLCKTSAAASPLRPLVCARTLDVPLLCGSNTQPDQGCSGVVVIGVCVYIHFP